MKNFVLSAIQLLIGSALMISCNQTKSDQDTQKAVLDTVSLRNKSFELAFQDGNKIVATSLDTMKQISFGGATNPALSPDGKKLAYTVSDEEGHRTIWIADLENKSQMQLQVNSNNYYGPIWSPDGKTIAFNIYHHENLWKIGLINVDQSGFIVLDSLSTRYLNSPTWKNNREIIGHDLVNLYTFDRTGKLINQKPIADLIGTDLSLSSSNHFFYTRDGQKIIFSAINFEKFAGSHDPLEAIYILDLTSKKVERISPKGMNAADLFVAANDQVFFSGAVNVKAVPKIYQSDLEGHLKLISNRGTAPTVASE